MPLNNLEGPSAGTCLGFMLFMKGLQNSLYRRDHVLKRTHNWIRPERRRINKPPVKEQRGSSSASFPVYVDRPAYYAGVGVIGLTCFMEGALKFWK